MFSRMLVPFDGSERSQVILPYVSQLGRGLDVPLVLLTVIERSVTEEEFSQGAEWSERMRHEAARRLQGVVDRLADEGVRGEAVVTSGRAAGEIANVAERYGCDLIAMATQGRSTRALGQLGSVTDRVAHSSRVPVLIITPAKAEMYVGHKAVTSTLERIASPGLSNIMVPLDGSHLAETVLPYVEELARKMLLKILLVRVVRPPRSVGRDSSPSGLSDQPEAIEAEADEYLRDTAAKLKGMGLDVRSQLLEGHAASSIIDLARQWPHDLIALATHGGSGWRLGSVAEALIVGTEDPVLIVAAQGDG